MLDLSNPAHAHADQRLRTDPMVWLCTVRPDGRPHVVPVWFLWTGESILIFSMPNNQKIRNLRQNPHVTLALDGTNSGSDIVTVEGTAELFQDPSLTPELPAYAEKYAELMRQINLPPEKMTRVYSQGIRITPTRLR